MNILITGASSGVGYQLAKNFVLNYNCKVLAVARSKSKLMELKHEINFLKTKGEIHILVGDISKSEFLSEINQYLKYNFKSLDVLINNAGHLTKKTFVNLTMEDWQNTYNINVFSVVAIVKELHHWLRKDKSTDNNYSQILNISSMGAIQGSQKFSGLSAYSSSKAALISITECLAEEFKNDNILVNAIALGSVQTEMFANAFPNFEAASTPNQISMFILNYIMENKNLMNGKTLQLSISTP